MRTVLWLPVFPICRAMAVPLESLLHHPAIWRVGDIPLREGRGIATGYSGLDAALADAGWPPGALSELLMRETGIGELSVVLPALRALSSGGRNLGVVAPPYLPHARALEAAGVRLDRLLVIDADGLDALWAAEQMLRAGVCGMVVIWTDRACAAVTHRALQRLHIAAGAGNTSCLIYRNASVQATPSPASLRLLLSAHEGRLQVDILKRRGALRGQPIILEPFPPHWRGGPPGSLDVICPQPSALQSSVA